MLNNYNKRIKGEVCLCGFFQTELVKTVIILKEITIRRKIISEEILLKVVHLSPQTIPLLGIICV